MAVLCDIFYVVLFITLAGSAFTLLVLLLERVFGIMLPLWAGILGMALYIVPIFSPGLFLISPEEQVWLEGYRIACAVWGCGAVLFALYGVLKIGLAHRAAGEWQVCREEGINAFCAECAAIAGLKRVPRIYFGTLEDPACVMGVLCPKIILNRRVAAKLTRAQLAVVLGHEVMHTRRAHMAWGRIFGGICILHWFNPFVWAAKKEFDFLCETDCDKAVLAVFREKTDSREYALTMLRLLELSVAGSSAGGSALSVSGFLQNKRRIVSVTHGQSRISSILSGAVLIAAVAAVACFSVRVSRGYFYPYPAYGKGIERCCQGSADTGIRGGLCWIILFPRG